MIHLQLLPPLVPVRLRMQAPESLHAHPVRAVKTGRPPSGVAGLLVAWVSGLGMKRGRGYTCTVQFPEACSITTGTPVRVRTQRLPAQRLCLPGGPGVYDLHSQQSICASGIAIQHALWLHRAN